MQRFSRVRYLTRCDQCAVRRSSFCGYLSEVVQHELTSISRTRSLRNGQAIQEEMGTNPLVGIVVSGALRIQKTLDDGRRPVLGLLLPSDFFGRAYAHHSNVAIEAASDETVVCCFDRQQFEKLAQRVPELEHILVLNTLDELDAARDCILLLGSRRVSERIASFMLTLYRRLKPDDGTAADNLRVPMPIGATDLAGYLATTRETISRVTKTMSRNGVIKVHDRYHFEVLNEHGLAKMARQEAPITGVAGRAQAQETASYLTHGG